MVRFAMGLLSGLVMATAVAAAPQDDTTWKAELNHDRCEVGDVLELKILVQSATLADAQLEDMLEKKLPDGLTLLGRYGPATQLAGDDTMTMEWTLELKALRAGRYEIPSLNVIVEEQGRMLATRPQALLVRETMGARMELQARVDRTVVYPHEPFELELLLALDPALIEHDRVAGLRLDQLPLPLDAITLLSLSEPGIQSMPATIGSDLRDELSGLAEHQRKMYFRVQENPLGQERHFVATLRLAMTRSVSEDEWRQTWGSLHVGLHELGGPSSQHELSCLPIRMGVRPVPEAVAAVGPVHGLGQFQLHIDVTPTQVLVEEPFWVTLTATGDGDFVNLELPDLTMWDQFLHLGREEHRGIRTRRVEYQMQLRDEETFSLPQVEWTVFDPSRADFVTHRVGPVPLRDVPPPVLPVVWWPWVVGFLFATIVGFSVIRPMRRVRRFLWMWRAKDVQEPIQDTVTELMTAYDAEELWQAVALYLSGPLNCSPEEIRSRSLLHLMESRGFAHELAARADSVQTRLEKALYGRDDASLEALKLEALELIREVQEGPVAEAIEDPPKR